MGQEQSQAQVSDHQSGRDRWGDIDSDADGQSNHGDSSSRRSSIIMFDPGNTNDSDHAVTPYTPGDSRASSQSDVYIDFKTGPPELQKIQSDIESARSEVQNGGTVLNKYRGAVEVLRALSRGVAREISRYEGFSFGFSRKGKARFQQNLAELKTLENRLLNHISDFQFCDEDAKMDSGDFIVLLDDLKAVILDVPQCVSILETIVSNKKQAKAERNYSIAMIISAFGSWAPSITGVQVGPIYGIGVGRRNGGRNRNRFG